MMNSSLVLLICFVLLFGFASAEAREASDSSGLLVVKAPKLYIGDGRVIENGAVVIKDGKIIQVGPLSEAPQGAAEIKCPSGVVTPGLIDASSTAGLIDKYSWTEHSSEVVSHLNVLDAVDMRSRDFERLARQGVTTVYVTPGSGSVVGCRGCVLKTAGPAGERIVVSRGSVKATMGRDSYRRGGWNRGPRGRVDFWTRRPTTRMGVTWIFREACFEARKYRDARTKPGAATVPHDAALESLAAVLDGQVRLRVQARKEHDIWSAIRLCKEFGVDLVLEEGTEAYSCVPELKEYGVPVVYGPVFAYPTGFRAGSGEANEPCLNTAGILHEAGLLFALTASDLSGEGALPHQAGFAVRAGLPRAAALRAVTAAPAEILGLSDRIGLLEPGYDADLVLWSGEPFLPTTRPIAVVVGGEPVHVAGITGAELRVLQRAAKESPEK